MRINCLGILVVDALSGPLERYPVPRLRPQSVTKSLRFAAGGGAANTSGALARMGLSAGVFSKIGDDPNGAFLRQELAGCGVDVSGIRVAAGETTPFTFVGVHPDGERTFIHTPGTNLTFSAADVDREAVLAADFLMYQDCWVLPAFDGAPAADLLAEARRRKVVILMDGCWGLGPRCDVLELALPHCDYALLSLEELRAVYPDWSLDRIADHMLGLGTGAVAIKLGAEGSLLAAKGVRERTVPLPAKVVDTTGAGDCWDAGFIAGLAHGLDPARAARVGHACAAFGIEQVGGATGVPDYASVFKRAGVG